LPWITKLPSFDVDTTVPLETVVGEFFDLFTVEFAQDFDDNFN